MRIRQRNDAETKSLRRAFIGPCSRVTTSSSSWGPRDVRGAAEQGPRDELELLFSLMRAEHQSLRLDACQERGGSASVTNLRCTYAFHALGSDEIGRRPFPGSYFDLIVEDGQISHVEIIVNIDEFSPQVWEPFAEWVSTTHPEDTAVTYTDDSYSLERVNEESIRLWDRHVRRYVEAVQRGDAT